MTTDDAAQATVLTGAERLAEATVQPDVVSTVPTALERTEQLTEALTSAAAAPLYWEDALLPADVALTDPIFASICKRDADRSAHEARSRARRAYRDALSGKRGFGRH